MLNKLETCPLRSYHLIAPTPHPRIGGDVAGQFTSCSLKILPQGAGTPGAICFPCIVKTVQAQ